MKGAWIDMFSTFHKWEVNSHRTKTEWNTQSQDIRLEDVLTTAYMANSCDVNILEMSWIQQLLYDSNRQSLFAFTWKQVGEKGLVFVSLLQLWTGLGSKCNCKILEGGSECDVLISPKMC